jgi:hypothetical protein
MTQPGLNVMTWTTDVNSSGFKIVSDVSFVGDVDYLIIPENNLTNAGTASLVGSEFVPKGETEVEVVFDKERSDADYQIFLQPNDNVNVWFENKTTQGFLLRIESDTDFAGKVDWQLYDSVLSGTVTFGGGSKFSDQVSIDYVDLDESSYLGYVEQGLAKMSLIEETGLISDATNGLSLDYDTDVTVNPGLSFEITDSNISYNNIRAFVKISNTWVEFTEEKNVKTEIVSTTKVFYVRVNKDKNISIKFGDGDKRGYDPTGSKIVIIGLDCVGEEGNIGENVLSESIVGSLNFETSNIVTETVEEAMLDLINVNKNAFFDGTSTTTLTDYRNQEISTTEMTVAQIGTGLFGTEPESVESLRNNAKLAHRSQNRVVTIEDYQTTLANEFSEFVIDVEVYNFKEANEAKLIPTDRDYRYYYNTLFFMMIPAFGTSFTQIQRETIKAFIDNKVRKFLATDTYILEPTFIPIDVALSYGTKVDASPIEVRNAINTGIYDFFDRRKRSLGETITVNDIKNNIVSSDLTELNMMLKRDENEEFTPSDYDVDIRPEDYQDAFADVEKKKLDELVKKELRNLIGKGLVELKQPLFDIQKPSGEREWQFKGDVVLERFEFPILGDLVIERIV